MSRSQSFDAAKERLLARRRPDPAGEQTPGHDAGVHPLLSLQRQVGNAPIARMLAQRAGEEDDQVQTKRVDRMLAQRAGEEDDQVQTKRVDRMLAQRAAEEDDQVQTKRVDRMLAQRAAEEDDQIQTKRVDRMLAQRAAGDEEPVQAAHEGTPSATPEVGPEGGEVSSALAGRINSSRGQGSPLDDGTRASLEGSFRTSFANVRVHTDGESDVLNRNLSAKAFTTGSDIFFSRGTYQPESSEGRVLLSHELAHVVQQRSMSGSGPMRVGPAGDSYEQQADSAAQSVTSSASSPQRQVDQDA
jgi:hypothetical protein